ncbi:hypothetical protein BBJ28_00006085 [Nothophytophthora sp. Chile5]|nr:hypothetical protein BBJ28_00006085 [Nothophytophthora sp. Chile5]
MMVALWTDLPSTYGAIARLPVARRLRGINDPIAIPPVSRMLEALDSSCSGSDGDGSAGEPAYESGAISIGNTVLNTIDVGETMSIGNTKFKIYS